MVRSRGLWATVTVLVGALQAWDSGVFGVSVGLQALAMCAIGATASAIALPVGQGPRIATLIAAAIALTVVRMVAPVSLNTLHLVLFVPALYILFVDRWKAEVVARG
jgi:hypothetical protein